MPGPGGGSRGGGGFRGGGGGFRGGSRGGGFHGGGFHGGGFHGGWHHRPFFGGWGFGPRYYGGGGCFGGLMSFIMAPVILIIMAVGIVISSFGTSFTVLNGGGRQVIYDENSFQDFADAQYAKEFGTSTAYEDNILLVFLAEDKEYYDYYYMAWVGDHIDTDINNMLGSNQTELGRAIAASVNEQSYKYSLDSNLAGVVNIMADHIEGKGKDSSFTCQEEHNQVESHLTNRTNIQLTEETVNTALKDFTDRTGIPIVIVVEDISEVLDERLPPKAIMSLVVAGGLVIIAIILIIRNIRNRKGGNKKDPEERKYDDRGNRI